MLHEKRQISIWYFIGLLVLVYGVLIFGAGVGELLSPPEDPRVLSDLHVGIWWGALLVIIGGIYVYFFRPGRAG